MKVTLFWEDGHTEVIHEGKPLVECSIDNKGKRYSSYVIHQLPAFDHTEEISDFIVQLNYGLLAGKPPIGLRPKYIVDQLRKKEILQASKRYIDAGKDVPQEWIEEYLSFYIIKLDGVKIL